MKLRLTFGLNLAFGLFITAGNLALGQQFAISTVAGFYSPGNTPTGALDVIIGTPAGIATDGNGNVYFSSSLSSLGRNQSFVLRIDSNGILTHVAGNPVAGYSGDGGPANSAMLNAANGVGVDQSGNLYIADTGNNRIRKVSTNGSITTIAGTGTAGYSGDGGPATRAMLNGPGLLAVDAIGNLYFGDWSSARIRKISTTGNISTIAGNGTPGYSGDGGPATSAQLGTVAGLAVDHSGNVYFSEVFSFEAGTGSDTYELVETRVRKISPNGTITTVAGSGTPGYAGDGGPAIAAELNSPGALAVDNNGIHERSPRMRKSLFCIGTDNFE